MKRKYLSKEMYFNQMDKKLFSRVAAIFHTLKIHLEMKYLLKLNTQTFQRINILYNN